MPLTIRLPRPLRDRLLQLANARPDEEICGLISGDGVELKRLYPVANIAADRTRFFEMDPQGQIDAMRDMRGRGEAIRAIYHSHPHGPATPSVRDVEHHEYPDAICLILAADGAGVFTVSGFHIREGRVVEVGIIE